MGRFLRSSWLPILVGLAAAAAGVGVSLATAWRTSWLAWLAASALAVGTVVGTVYLQHRDRLAERQRESASPQALRRLVDESAFVTAVTDWPGNVNMPAAVAEVLRSHLAPAALVLIDRSHARRSLQDAETALKQFEALDDPSWQQAYQAVRLELCTLLENLPPLAAYLERLADVAGPERVDVIRNGYYRALSVEGDRYAYKYLLLLRELGEHEALLDILKDRILQLIDERHLYYHAWNATCQLAVDVLGDGFEAWWRLNFDTEPP